MEKIDYNRMLSPEIIMYLDRSVKAARAEGNEATAIDSDRIISDFSDKLSTEEYKSFDWEKAEAVLFAKLIEIEKKYSAQAVK